MVNQESEGQDECQSHGGGECSLEYSRGQAHLAGTRESDISSVDSSGRNCSRKAQ